jgi:hypothetical protein
VLSTYGPQFKIGYYTELSEKEQARYTCAIAIQKKLDGAIPDEAVQEALLTNYLKELEEEEKQQTKRLKTDENCVTEV